MASRIVTLPGFHECPECGGRGFVKVGPYNEPEACRECGGAGQVPDDDTVETVARSVAAFHRPGRVELEFDINQQTYRREARAALLAYARHTQETKP